MKCIEGYSLDRIKMTKICENDQKYNKYYHNKYGEYDWKLCKCIYFDNTRKQKDAFNWILDTQRFKSLFKFFLVDGS